MKKNWLYIGAIALGGLLFRLINLRAEPFWGDEILSLGITRHFESVGTLINYIREVEFHPPLYYLMLRPWVEWFGAETGAVRSLSVIFGVATIILVYVLGKRIFKSEKIGLIAAAVTAVLPFQIEFSQEARPYMIFCFFGGLGALALWEYLSSRKKIWLAVYVLSALIGLYLHYSYLFWLAALALYWLFEAWRSVADRPRALLVWFSSHAAIVLGFAWWLPAFLLKLVLSSHVIFGLARNVVPERPPHFFEFVFDQIVWLTKFEELPKISLLAKLAVKLSFLAGLLYLVWQRSQALFENRRALFFLLWLFLVPVVFFAVSFQAVSYTTIFVRHVIICTIPLALLVGAFVSSFKPRVAAAMLAIFLISLIPFSQDIVGNDEAWDLDFQFEKAAGVINELYQPGDIVVVSVGIMRSDLQYYLRPEIPVVELLPINYYGLDFWNSRNTLGFVENEYQVRIKSVTTEEMNDKMNRFQNLYQPKRYWLYGFSRRDTAVRDWFFYNNYHHRIRSIADIFRLDLYSPN